MLIASHRTAIVLAGASALLAIPAAAYAADSCAAFTFGTRRALVERYKPGYLIGQGLEDVHMADVAGSSIRYKWSTQAAACIGSSNSYGYFFHPDFDRTACVLGEVCFPGFRHKHMSERLADILSVVQQMAVPSGDATYQTNLNTAYPLHEPRLLPSP